MTGLGKAGGGDARRHQDTRHRTHDGDRRAMRVNLKTCSRIPDRATGQAEVAASPERRPGESTRPEPSPRSIGSCPPDGRIQDMVVGCARCSTVQRSGLTSYNKAYRRSACCADSAQRPPDPWRLVHSSCGRDGERWDGTVDNAITTACLAPRALAAALSGAGHAGRVPGRPCADPTFKDEPPAFSATGAAALRGWGPPPRPQSAGACAGGGSPSTQ